MHMIEHLLLGDIAALLIVLGLTGPLLAPVLRIALLRPPARALAPADRLPAVGDRPVRVAPAGPLRSGAAPLRASTRSSTRCSSASASTCGCACSARCPRPSWFGNLGKLIYIVAVRLAGTILGNIFLWSGTVFYPYYMRRRGALPHLAARRPEHRGGDHDGRGVDPHARPVLLAVPAHRARERGTPGACSTTPSAQGLELSEERAARAVAAGRGAELRRRLEAHRTHPIARGALRRARAHIAATLAACAPVVRWRPLRRRPASGPGCRPTTSLAHPAPDAPPDDRRDVRRRPRLDDRLQRLDARSGARQPPTRAGAARVGCVSPLRPPAGSSARRRRRPGSPARRGSGCLRRRGTR